MNDKLQRDVEALLFIAQEPLTLKEIAQYTGSDEQVVIQCLQELKKTYQGNLRGIWLQESAGGWRFVTSPYAGEVVERYEKEVAKERISPQAMEVLAIIAYKQPITLPEINAIRGVQSQQTLHTLLEKRLIRPLGRKEVLGRPILYGTTKEFLLHFGLTSLEDLPPLEKFLEHAAE